VAREENGIRLVQVSGEKISTEDQGGENGVDDNAR
jgi:hypothetical protein